jgi:hypothetical protein
MTSLHSRRSILSEAGLSEAGMSEAVLSEAGKISQFLMCGEFSLQYGGGRKMSWFIPCAVPASFITW